jgi:hypothetical protein
MSRQAIFAFVIRVFIAEERETKLMIGYIRTAANTLTGDRAI